MSADNTNNTNNTTTEITTPVDSIRFVNFKCIDEFMRLKPNWFSKESMAFFNSKIHNTVYGGCIFISSEQDKSPFGHRAWNGQRRYSVRVMDQTGGMWTWMGFGAFGTLLDAKKEAQWLAKQVQAGKVYRNGYDLAVQS